MITLQNTKGLESIDLLCVRRKLALKAIRVARRLKRFDRVAYWQLALIGQRQYCVAGYGHTRECFKRI